MKYLNGFVWILALFPWLDFAIRQVLPSAVGGIWDDGLLLLALAAVWFYKRHEPRYLGIPSAVTRPLLAFLLFSAGSIVVNVVPLAVSIDAVRVVFQPMFFALVMLYLVDEQAVLDRFIRVLVASTVVIAVFGIIQYIFQIDTGMWQHTKDTEQFRIVSIFSNPNALAAYFNMVLSFTVASVLMLKDMKQRALYLAASGIIAVALLLTFSRSAWLAFLVIILYLVFVWNKKWLVAIPVFLAAAPFVLPPGVVSRFAKLLDPAYYQMSSEYGRLAFWSTALEKIRDYPFFGVGLGTFGDSVPLRHSIPFATWVDNHYLKLGAEVGIIGAISFVVLLWVLFRLAHSLYRRAESDQLRVYALGAAGVVITMAVQNVTASIFEALTDAIYFYVFAGLLFLLNYRRQKAGSGER